MLIIVTASIIASILYGVGASLQRQGLLLASPGGKMDLKLIPKLFMQPVWMAGSIMGIVGIGLELVALHKGSLTIVIPLLATGLVVALGLDAILTKARLPMSAWILSIVVAAGTAVFVVSVGSGTTHVANQLYLLIASLSAVALSAVLWLLPGLDRREPWLMGSGAAYVLAVSTALAKAAIANIDKGITPALISWDTYAAVIIGTFGTVLLQHAYKSGPLAKSLPASTVVQPVAGVLLGMWAFSEQFGVGSTKVAMAIISLTITLVALWALSKCVANILPTTATTVGSANSEPTPPKPTNQARTKPANYLDQDGKLGFTALQDGASGSTSTGDSS